METKQVFISHCDKDKEIAELLALTMEGLSNGKIKFWFSSDKRPDRGLQGGDIFCSKIIESLESSNATIILISPRSMARPWVLFESGLAQGMANHVVKPVFIGIEPNNTIQPLGMYQGDDITNIDSLKKFISELSTSLGNTIDIEFHKNEIETLHLNIVRVIKKINETLQDPIAQRTGIINEPHLLPVRINMGSKKGQMININIENEDTVQRILDKVFFHINDNVRPYTYMESWVLKEVNTGAYLIMYEIANIVPAKYIFRSHLRWEVVEWNNGREYKETRDRFRAGINCY